MRCLSNRDADDRKVLLLDLVWTLAIRQGNWGSRNYADVIRATETYRVALLDQIQAQDFFVILLTARSHRYADVTLENIQRHTQWLPDVAIFNEHELEPPAAKLAALNAHIYPTYGTDRSRYVALESNNSTRAMYAKQGIEAMRWEDYMGNGTEQLTLFGGEKCSSVNQFVGDENSK